MEVRIYNDSNTPSSKYRSKPKITFNEQGKIMINQAAVILLELPRNGRFSIAQDKHTPKDWYLIEDPQNGFKWTVYKNGMLVVSRMYIVDKFMRGLNAFAKSIVCPIGEEAITVDNKRAWPIITANINTTTTSARNEPYHFKQDKKIQVKDA